MFKFIRKPMRSRSFPNSFRLANVADSDPSIAVSIKSTGPNPARVGLSDSFPEFNRIHSIRSQTTNIRGTGFHLFCDLSKRVVFPQLNHLLHFNFGPEFILACFFHSGVYIYGWALSQ